MGPKGAAGPERARPDRRGGRQQRPGTGRRSTEQPERRDWDKPHPSLVAVASKVIQGSDREHPADRVLAQVLGTDPWLDARVKGEIAEAVFSFFRWWGWLDAEMRRPQQLTRARELARAYEQDPRAVPVAELKVHAVPGWVHGAVDVEESWLRMLQGRPLLWLRARPGSGGELLRELGSGVAEPGGLPDAICYRGDADLHEHPHYTGGKFEIQDLSSQAVGLLCAARPGERWWDVCAGEGGKTLHLAQMMENKGQVWATDRAGWRLQRLKRRAARAGVSNYQATVWKGEGVAPIPFPCDGVLVDAPCTGIGTWHRNPHARWTVLEQDVKELAEVQWGLLEKAAGRVKPGGRLIYSVCTLSKAETTGVADRADAAFKDFEPLPMVNPLGGSGESSGRLWLKPWALGGNGMFVAGWRRRK